MAAVGSRSTVMWPARRPPGGPPGGDDPGGDGGPMEDLIRRQCGPAGDPPVLIHFSVSDALGRSRPSSSSLRVLQVLMLQ